MASITGIGLFGNYSPQVSNDISVFAINYFVNRCPLVTRLPRVGVGSTAFDMIARSYRARTSTITEAIGDTSTTSVTLADGTMFGPGDVLKIDSEYVEITSISSNVATVVRGVSSTTAATHSDNAVVTYITNSRTGGEVDQSGIAHTPVAVTQYCQTLQEPVQIGGSVLATMNFALPPGAANPFDSIKDTAMQNMMDNLEVACYIGKGDAGSSGNKRPKMKGLSQLLTTNNVTSPTNAGAYKPTDFIRDALQGPRAAGGSPDVVLVSTEYMSGLATWGHAVQQVQAGTNIFGTPIKVFEAPFIPGVTIVEAPLLPSYTAVALTSSEVCMRMKRNEQWIQRGNRGDAVEGDWLVEGAIQPENEAHHAWVTGVTAFSAT